MGKIRTKDIKDVAKAIYESDPGSVSKDFESNKQTLKEMGIINEKSKRHRNRIAGYLVRIARTAERRGEVHE
ncbi:MAG: 30S ribosomal protein S17e [Candidatus Aenigmarchaeota archaeon]|nr:30S ribosomal protein S17e [Candidatus Aenigmarchaeota archaeon]